MSSRLCSVALAAGLATAFPVPGPRAAGLQPDRYHFLGRAGANDSGGQAPKVCIDSGLFAWSDLHFNGCDTYSDSEWCTPEGGYGPGWNQAAWGEFSSWAFPLRGSAVEVCCACGGGTQGDAQACTTFTCPTGYAHKADAAKAYCKVFQCSLKNDLETCCEAPPEISDGVKSTQDLIKALEEEVKKNISVEGEILLTELAADSSESRDGKLEAMHKSWGEASGKAVSEAKATFDAQASGSSTLADSARYQIAVAGYVAARDATDAAVFDKSKLQSLLQHATASFVDSQSVWTSASEQGLKLQTLAAAGWGEHHADLNATWPLVVRGVEQFNTVLKQSHGPMDDARWAEESSRLAADLAQTAKSNSKGLMAMAEAAEARANAALKLTGSNTGQLDDLDALVTRVGLSMDR